jgi:NTE family protein
MVDAPQIPPGSQGPAGQSGNAGTTVNPHALGPAIVLSGGGAKGDFEVGAVRCLYNNGIQPKILCGTSVGSVNALKLAEGETSATPTPVPAGHVRGLAGLEKIWLGLNVDQDMWMLDPLVADLFDTIHQLPADLQKIQSDGSVVLSSTIGGFFESLIGIPGFLSFAPQASALNNLSDDAQTLIQAVTVLTSNAGNVQGMITYDPLQALMRESANFFPAMQAESGIVLRLAMVALEDGALRYVSETNTMLERNGAVTAIPPGPTAAELAKYEAQAAQLQADINTLMPSGGGGLPFQKPGPGLSSKRQQLALLHEGLQEYPLW